MEDSNIFPLAKLTPISGDLSSEEIILSNEFCYSLSQVFGERKSSDLFDEALTYAVVQMELDQPDDKDYLPTNEGKNGNICYCILNSLKTPPTSKMKLSIDAIVFSLVMDEVKRSRTFRMNVLKRFCHFIKHVDKPQRKLKSCVLCKKKLWLLYVSIYLSPVKKNILDYNWNKKLEILVNERCELENAMAWLSTLGGAFSALGDYFTDCAEKAGLISVQQFRLALRLGDPITICQCKIYLAMSFIQRGQFSKAKHLIRELYSFAIGPEGSKDFRLKNMCIAVWNKLRYVKSLKKMTSV